MKKLNPFFVSFIWIMLVSIPVAHAEGNSTVCESVTNPSEGLYFSFENGYPTANASEVEFMYLNIKSGGTSLKINFGADYEGTPAWGHQCEIVPGTKLRNQLSLDQSYYVIYQGHLKCSQIEVAEGKKEDLMIDVDVDASRQGSVQVSGPSVKIEMKLKPPTH